MEKSDAERIKDLEARIEAFREKDAPKHHSQEHYSQANIAWRMVIEMVTGLGLGVAIGMGLDALLDTKPVLMVVFLFFGLAAGVQTMLRTAKELQTNGAEMPQTEGDGRGEYDD